MEMNVQLNQYYSLNEVTVKAKAKCRDLTEIRFQEQLENC